MATKKLVYTRTMAAGENYATFAPKCSSDDAISPSHAPQAECETEAASARSGLLRLMGVAVAASFFIVVLSGAPGALSAPAASLHSNDGEVYESLAAAVSTPGAELSAGAELQPAAAAWTNRSSSTTTNTSDPVLPGVDSALGRNVTLASTNATAPTDLTTPINATAPTAANSDPYVASSQVKHVDDDIFEDTGLHSGALILGAIATLAVGSIAGVAFVINSLHRARNRGAWSKGAPNEGAMTYETWVAGAKARRAAPTHEFGDEATQTVERVALPF